jgi:hypothetical protein
MTWDVQRKRTSEFDLEPGKKHALCRRVGPANLAPVSSRTAPEMRLKHLLIATTLGLVAAVSGEIVSRVDDYFRFGIPIWHTPNSDRDLKLENHGWTRGRANGRYRHYQLNSFGFRSPEMTRTPRADCTRVMVLGSSETFGYYESPGKEYPAQLGDSLRGRGCYEVVNAGLAGMTTRSIVNLWNNYAGDFAPQVVLIYASPMFYLGGVKAEWPQPDTASGPLPDMPLPFRPRLIEQAKNVFETPRAIQRRRIERWIAGAVQGQPPEWFYREPPKERLNLFISDLDSLVTAVRARGAEPVLMTHAMRFSGKLDERDEFILFAWRQFTPRATEEAMLAFEREAAAAVRDLSAKRGLRMVDLDRALTGRRELFADFAHFTDDGAAAAAGVIAREITLDVHLAGAPASH